MVIREPHRHRIRRRRSRVVKRSGKQVACAVAEIACQICEQVDGTCSLCAVGVAEAVIDENHRRRRFPEITCKLLALGSRHAGDGFLCLGGPWRDMLFQLHEHSLAGNTRHRGNRFEPRLAPVVGICDALVNETANRLTRCVRTNGATCLLAGLALDSEEVARLVIDENELAGIAALFDIGLREVLTVVVAHEIGGRRAVHYEVVINHSVCNEDVRHA